MPDITLGCTTAHVRPPVLPAVVMGRPASAVHIALPVSGAPGADGQPGTPGPPGEPGDGAEAPIDLTLLFENALA